MASLFHVYFPGKSFELDSSRFVQVDTQRWVMDMSIYVGEEWCHALLCKTVVPLRQTSDLVLLGKRTWDRLLFLERHTGDGLPLSRLLITAL
jgi:hypothetical protein